MHCLKNLKKTGGVLRSARISFIHNIVENDYDNRLDASALSGLTTTTMGENYSLFLRALDWLPILQVYHIT